jgi:hypothetical protein
MHPVFCRLRLCCFFGCPLAPHVSAFFSVHVCRDGLILALNNVYVLESSYPGFSSRLESQLYSEIATQRNCSLVLRESFTNGMSITHADSKQLANIYFRMIGRAAAVLYVIDLFEVTHGAYWIQNHPGHQLDWL